jgi:hypothetical protein
MYSTTQKLWETAVKKGWTNGSEPKKWEETFTMWKFKDDQKDVPAAAPVASKITVPFWQNYGDYTVVWDFDAATDSYKRSVGGAPHMDLNKNQQLAVKNVVVQFEKESHANDGYEGNAHLIYGTTGQGKALIFQDGKVIDGKWIKPTRLARTKYVDSKDKEIQFNKGPIWIQTVPEGSSVTY